MPERFGPEAQLLLCCASPVEDAEQIRSLSSQSLDWDLLVDMAAAQGVAPLLYWRLKAIRPEAIPASLAASFQENTRNSVHLTSALFQLLELFSRAGIAALPFKGPTLAVAAYGNLALRRFKDLDLFVPKKDAIRARQLLIDNGYSSTVQLNSRWQDAYLRVYDEFGLLGPDDYPLVELHWAVTPRYFSVALDILPFWERTITVNLGGRGVSTLGPSDLLLALCLHASKHCWSRLSMVADVAWLISRAPCDWGEVLDRARALGCRRMVLLGANLSASLLQAPVPKEVAQEAVSDAAVQRLAGEVTALPFRPKDSDSGILKAAWFHMRARERWMDRCRYFLRLGAASSVEDWQAANLPSGLAFLYPALRAPRLLRKYWMRVP